jgi:hypothetical protein
VLQSDTGSGVLEADITGSSARNAYYLLSGEMKGRGGGAQGPEGQMGSRSSVWIESLQEDPAAVIQTGPGLPAWSGRVWTLAWEGPVERDQAISLVLIPPWLDRALGGLGFVLLVLVASMVLREAARSIRRRDPPARTTNGLGAAAATGAALSLALLLAPDTAAADRGCSVVSLEGLPKVKEIARLLDPGPACDTECVSTSRLHVGIEGDRLTVTAEVHAGSAAGWRLPGPPSAWQPDEVEVDGRVTSRLVKHDNGNMVYLYVRVEPGLHRIVATGPADGDGIDLSFDSHVRHLTATAPGWKILGLRDDGLVPGSIAFVREKRPGPGAEPDGGTLDDTGDLAPWFEVTRMLDIGLPWVVRTRVERIWGGAQPVTVRVPLVPGEAVNDPAITIENSEAVVSFDYRQLSVAWQSVLSPLPDLVLTAAVGRPWSEVWQLRCSDIWRCRAGGNAPRNRESAVFERIGEERLDTFRPRPGETLELSFQRPKGVTGESVTIDSAKLELWPASRSTRARLLIGIRTSRGGEQRVTLPEGAIVSSLRVHDNERPFTRQERRIDVTLEPGEQSVEITWRQPGGIGQLYRAPEVLLGRPVANATVEINAPEERWPIWFGGPANGPVVLWWGYLLLLLAAGFAIGRWRGSPLRSWQWMVLALGLTSTPPLTAILVASWPLLLAWRARGDPWRATVHDALQIALAAAGVVALVALFVAGYRSLSHPDMLVAGNGSNALDLVWSTGHSEGDLPRPWMITLPLRIWEGLMIVWAFVVFVGIVLARKRVCEALSKDGLWKPLRGVWRKPKPKPEPG